MKHYTQNFFLFFKKKYHHYKRGSRYLPKYSVMYKATIQVQQSFGVVFTSKQKDKCKTLTTTELAENFGREVTYAASISLFCYFSTKRKEREKKKKYTYTTYLKLKKNKVSYKRVILEGHISYMRATDYLLSDVYIFNHAVNALQDQQTIFLLFLILC